MTDQVKAMAALRNEKRKGRTVAVFPAKKGTTIRPHQQASWGLGLTRSAGIKKKVKKKEEKKKLWLGFQLGPIESTRIDSALNRSTI